MGLAFLPALYVKSEIRRRDALRICDVEGITVVRNHVLAWRPRSPARALFRGLAEKIRELVRKRLSDAVLPAKT
jgi:LysR family hydrogen peroxide-inducible transcriptional activator